MVKVLNDVLERTIDYRGKTPKVFDSGIPVISAANIKNGKIIIDKKFVSQEYFEKWSVRGFIKPGDILITTEAPVGEIARVPSDQIYLISRRVIALQVDPNKADERYVYYFLRSDFVIKYFESLSHGATVPRVYKEDILNLKTNFPELKTQQKIASILSAYDDLIENNNQRIQLLEEMASEIYKEWFVRLRFPGYENAVFRDKNGKKVDRESDRALPNGWKKEQLREHINFYRGKSYSSAELRDNEGLAMINLKNIQRQGGFRLDGLKYFEGKYNLNNEAYSGDIVMAVTDMTQEREIVGRVALVPDMGIEKFIISMDLIRIEPISLPKLYLYCFLRYSGIGLQLKEFANGANVLHLTPSLIEFQKAVIPPAAICEKFEELIKPMLSEIDVLNNKNQVLQETRDLLLPRLISGKLSVEHLLNETYEPKEAIRTAAEPTAVYETKSIK